MATKKEKEMEVAEATIEKTEAVVEENPETPTEKKAKPKTKAKTRNNTQKVLKPDETVKRLISKQTLLKGTVMGARRDDSIGDHVVIYYDNREFVISKNELGLTQEVKNVLNFIGKAVYFVAMEYDGVNNRIIASRAKSQEIMLQQLLAENYEGKVYKGEIVALLSYGAFVEVNGVSGLLKNGDFSLDHLQVSDIYKNGDEIEVCLKKSYSENKIAFEVPNKFTKIEHPNLERYKVDDVVEATVVSDKGTHFFARIMPGIDVYCKPPFNDEVFVGDKILIKMIENKKGENGELILRGKWIKTKNKGE